MSRQALGCNSRRFTDAQGKVVKLHGTNMINKLPPYEPAVLGLDEGDLRFLGDNGFNGIRLGFSWAGVEPSPGIVDVAVCALPIGCPRYDLLKLAPFYTRVLQAIRAVGARRLIFVEPSALLDRADQQMLSWMHWADWAQDFGEAAT